MLPSTSSCGIRKRVSGLDTQDEKGGKGGFPSTQPAKLRRRPRLLRAPHHPHLLTHGQIIAAPSPEAKTQPAPGTTETSFLTPPSKTVNIYISLMPEASGGSVPLGKSCTFARSPPSKLAAKTFHPVSGACSQRPSPSPSSASAWGTQPRERGQRGWGGKEDSRQGRGRSPTGDKTGVIAGRSEEHSSILPQPGSLEGAASERGFERPKYDKGSSTAVPENASMHLWKSLPLGTAPSWRGLKTFLGRGRFRIQTPGGWCFLWNVILIVVH